MTSITTEESPIAYHNGGSESRKLFDSAANSNLDEQKHNVQFRVRKTASLETPKLVSRPLPNHGLMVMFGKRKYFQYKCNLTKAVFPTRRDLLKFEHALSFQEEVIAAYTVAFETNAEAMARECIHPREKYKDLPSVVNDKKKAENISVDSTVVCAFGAEVSKMLKDCINHGQRMDIHCLDSFCKKQFGCCVGCKILEASVKLRKCPPPAPSYPKHLYRFLDGSVFTSIVWEGFLTLKRTAFIFSCVLLLQLLGGPYSSETWKVVDTAADRYKSRKMACRPHL